MKQKTFLTIKTLFFCLSGICADAKEMEESRMVSRANPYYYCFVEDYEFAKKQHGEKAVTPLVAISQHGCVDIDSMAKKIDALQNKINLNPVIFDLFYNKLVPQYQKNNYTGSHTSVTGQPSMGWFGGISIVTLGMLDDIMKVQSELPQADKMKFMGIGSGNAFFEYLLSHIGETTAMDVIHRRKEDFSEENMYDGLKIAQMLKDRSFFMKVDIKLVSDEGDKDKIVSEIFKDKNCKNTILVMSWPRKFAIPYIHAFFAAGGQSVLFVRNEAAGGVLTKGHLGEIDQQPNIEFKKYLNQKFRVSLDLNTVTFSTVDLYSKKKNTPIERALLKTKARFNK